MLKEAHLAEIVGFPGNAFMFDPPFSKCAKAEPVAESALAECSKTARVLRLHQLLY